MKIEDEIVINTLRASTGKNAENFPHARPAWTLVWRPLRPDIARRKVVDVTPQHELENSLRQTDEVVFRLRGRTRQSKVSTFQLLSALT